MNMVTPVRGETFEKLVFNAGILLKNLDYSSATDANSLMELIKTAKETGKGLLGATKGGVNAQTIPTVWVAEMDGKRTHYKGEEQLDTVDCKISGTLVEFTPNNVKDVLAMADITGTGTKIEVQPRLDIQEGDYIDHIIWVGNLGKDGLYLVDLKNALCTSGLNTQSTDKDIGTLPFEFVGHADDVSDTVPPIKYLFFGKAAE